MGFTACTTALVTAESFMCRVWGTAVMNVLNPGLLNTTFKNMCQLLFNLSSSGTNQCVPSRRCRRLDVAATEDADACCSNSRLCIETQRWPSADADFPRSLWQHAAVVNDGYCCLMAWHKCRSNAAQLQAHLCCLYATPDFHYFAARWSANSCRALPDSRHPALKLTARLGQQHIVVAMEIET